MKHGESLLDLAGGVPRAIRENQGNDGLQYIVEIDGLREQVALPNEYLLGPRLSKRLRAEQDWFEKLVHHAPTVGSFYEALLRNIVREIAPSRFRIGTGFVYDTVHQRTSNQLDLILYDPTNTAPLFQGREFVVVPSGIVQSIAEIKKVLKLQHVREHIRKTVNFRFGTYSNTLDGVQYSNLFAYRSSCTTKAIFTCINDELTTFVNEFYTSTVGGAPVIMSALHVTLPRVYFFDRQEFLETSLTPSTDGPAGTYAVHVGIYHSPTDQDDGLNPFLSSMLAEEFGTTTNLRNLPLLEEKESCTITRSLVLTTKISLRALVGHFPEERERLKQLGKHKHSYSAALIPKNINWKTMPNLESLEKLPGFRWI